MRRDEFVDAASDKAIVEMRVRYQHATWWDGCVCVDMTPTLDQAYNENNMENAVEAIIDHTYYWQHGY